jgi:uncharacterized protein YjiS (DUF1127 family)
MTMIPDARYQLIASRLVGGVLLETCLAGTRALARTLRWRKDRAHLCELPEYLLRDIGIERFEVGAFVRFGARDTGRQQRA